VAGTLPPRPPSPSGGPPIPPSGGQLQPLNTDIKISEVDPGLNQRADGEETAAAKAKAEEEAEKAKLRAEEEAARANKIAEEEAAIVKQRAEEEAAIAKQKAEEEATIAKQKAEEEAVKSQAEEEAAKRQAEEVAAKRQAEEEAAKRQAEEVAAKRQAEEDAAKRQAEEDAAKRQAEEDAAKRQAEEDAAKRQAEEDALKLKVEEEATRGRQKVDEEAEMARQKVDEVKGERGIEDRVETIATHVGLPPEPNEPPPVSKLSITPQSQTNIQSVEIPKPPEPSGPPPDVDRTKSFEQEDSESDTNESKEGKAPRVNAPPPPAPPKEKLIAEIEAELDAVDDHAPISLATMPPRTIPDVPESLDSSKYSKSLLVRGLFHRPKGANKDQPSVVDSILEDEKFFPYLSGNLTQDELMIRQLQGIFSLHDEDKDGKINRQQLSACLKLLGFQVRDKLLLKYLNPTGDTSLSGGSKKSNNLTAFAIAKVDLLTFLHVTVRELPSIQSKLKEDLVFLFEFLDPKKTGFVTVKDLRHMLTETMNGNDLNGNLFLTVLEAGGITVESIRQEKSLSVNYNALIDNFLMCNRWQTMLL
jgi:Ca2+-binding EF-hand superfamily protein